MKSITNNLLIPPVETINERTLWSGNFSQIPARLRIADQSQKPTTQNLFLVLLDVYLYVNMSGKV